MSERRRCASLAIVTAYPPPYGGVSVEVQRLRPLLDRRGVHYIIYNAVSQTSDGDRVVSVSRLRGPWLLGHLFFGAEPAVYLMSARLAAWVAGAIAAVVLGKRVMVQLRNSFLDDWLQRSRLRAAVAGWALRRMTRVVCVSHLLMRAAARAGVDPRRLHWCPAFLPPGLVPVGREDVAPLVWEFAGRHRPLIAANGKVHSHQGQDLYGLDHLVDLIARLKPDYPSAGIVVCFFDHGPRDEPYLNEVKRRAAARGVAGDILFNTASGPFIPVLEAADLFVRPTNTDGDAVSVREALYLGVPAIASDAVERPAGTVLFRVRDLDDFEAKVRAALQSLPRRVPGPRGSLLPQDQQRIESYVDMLAAVAEGRELPAPASGEAPGAGRP